MSKITVFDLNNYSLGHFTGICDRGYIVDGVSTTSSGGATSIIVEREVLEAGWIAPGRLILVEDSRLEPWVGVIDMPMGLVPPAQIAVYNGAYLLNIRTPDAPVKLTGTAGTIISRLIDMANEQEEMYVRLGENSASQASREDTIDQRPIWEQLIAIAGRSKTELIIRPKREITDGNRLYTYIDLYERAGIDTDFLLHDGEGGNMTVKNATIDRPVWNHVVAINGASTAAERLTTEPMRDEDSINTFRLRSRVPQFRNTISLSVLDQQGRDYLSANSMPILKFEVLIKDVGDTFANIRRGNGVLLHASKVRLFDGRKGWRGTARIISYAYNEKQNTIGAMLEAKYEFI